MEVRIHEPDRMSLPGLLAAGLLARQCTEGRVIGLRGDVLLDVAGARVTLRFGDDLVEVTLDAAVAPIAEIHGGYAALVDLSAGRRLRAFRGGLRVRGRPGTLMALLPLLRIAP
jgi:hypothetical protein